MGLFAAVQMSLPDPIRTSTRGAGAGARRTRLGELVVANSSHHARVRRHSLSSHHSPHDRPDRPRLLSGAGAAPTASAAVTAILPFLRTAGVRAMRTALPGAHRGRACNKPAAWLSPPLDGAQRTNEIRAELQVAARHADRERPAPRTGFRRPIANDFGEVSVTPNEHHFHPLVVPFNSRSRRIGPKKSRPLRGETGPKSRPQSWGVGPS